MKNKIYLKKTLLILTFSFIFFIIVFLFVNNKFYKMYIKNYNEKVSAIIYSVKEKYPNISDSEIANIINSEENAYDMAKFGIKVDEESIVLKNDKLLNYMLLSNFFLLFFFFIIVVIIYIKYSKIKDDKISEINKMVEEISIGNYELDLKNRNEDDLSIFKDNLYKITLKLKEEADNSLKDKKELKENLENISHQLKTPLTAMTISIDNILESNSISDEKRKEFLIDIKKEINNINFFIINLLQLSRFEVNVVKFDRKNNNIIDILKQSLKKVELLRDLKDIKIKLAGEKENFLCDFNWEVEALTNIVKNAIEHSSNDSKVTISVDRNNTYLCVKITNDGVIDEKDVKNIFKRFYKGANSANNSIGIGLALSKYIVEKDNGKIFVKCENNQTTFEIKYYFV